MVVRKPDDTAKVHLSEITSVVLQTEQAYVSVFLLAELAKAKISLVVSDEKHNPIGQYLPLYGAHNVSRKVLEQIEWGEPSKKRVWQRIVRDKIRAQAAVLKMNGLDRQSRMLAAAVGEVRSGDTTNREAMAARLYFTSLFGSDFNRDLDEPINAALNYGYAILLSMANREIVSRGYLTQLGIFHHNEYNQFNLACDFMEPFRPVVDITVLEYLDHDFDKDMKRALLDIPNRMLSYRDGKYKLQSVLGLYVQDCFSALEKRIVADDIKGYEFL